MTKLIDFIKHNIVGLFIFILFISIFYVIYSNFKSNKLNSSIIEIKVQNPYVLATQWNTIIKRDRIITVKEKEKEIIKLNDKIKTLSNSTATIFWPDGSVTRLWNKTSITINELNTNNDLSTYKINFDIESGKTWSNIIKFLTDKSYFTETYDNWNFAATARWTVFEINLDNDYIHAVSHDINLSSKNNTWDYNIKQWELFKAHNPKTKASVLNIDKNWITTNIKNDTEYLNNLMKDWQNKIATLGKQQSIWSSLIPYLQYKTWYNKDNYISEKVVSSLNNLNSNILTEAKNNIPKLSKEEKEKLNSKLLNIYEWVHYLPNSPEIANYKSNLRDLILQTWDNEKTQNIKEQFLKLDIYDYIDIVKSNGETEANLLKNNINKYLEEIKDSNKMKTLLSSFSWEMLDIIKTPFDSINKELKKMLESNKDSNIKDRIKEWIIEEATNIKNSFDDIIWWLKNKIWK